MDVPTSTAAVAAIVALLVPGLVYSGVRTTLTGYRGTDKALTSRIAHAITIGVLLNALYLACFGRFAYEAFTFVAQDEQVIVADAAGAGRAVIGLGVVAPSALAVLVHGVPWRSVPGVRAVLARLGRCGLLAVNRTPSAWDFAGRTKDGVFLRVTRADGTIVGGWYGRGSFMSGYPEPRDVFIAEQWSVDAAGRFEAAIANSAGVWIAVRDDDILEWSRQEEPTDDQTSTS